jgi:hypothetical protein
VQAFSRDILANGRCSGRRREFSAAHLRSERVIAPEESLREEAQSLSLVRAPGPNDHTDKHRLFSSRSFMLFRVKLPNSQASLSRPVGNQTEQNAGEDGKRLAHELLRFLEEDASTPFPGGSDERKQAYIVVRWPCLMQRAANALR